MLKRAGDLIYTFRFLKLLTTKFEDTVAYDLGIIDENGKRNKSVRLDTSEKKSAYTPFHRLVFNLKKIINKSGSEKFASYAAALFLIKEDVNLDKILKASRIQKRDFINENSKWFILEDGRLAPGIYHVKSDKLINENFDDLVMSKDKIRVIDGYPIGEIFDIDIFEAIHLKTQKKIYVTIGELYK